MPGAAAEIVAREVGGPFDVRESVVVVNAGVVTTLMGGNPERVGWFLANRGANDVFFAFSQDFTAANGLPLAANGGTVSVDVREDFLLTIFPVYATATVGSHIVRVVELVRSAGPRREA